MTAKHTPGPWSVAYMDKNGQAVVMAEHIEVATCWHHCVMAIEKEMHMNARLIASAPDLLEALTECIECEFATTDKDALAKAKAAIAKATGESA